MTRTPITTETTEPAHVILVKQAMTFEDLLPRYHYQFQNQEPSEEPANMYSSLCQFLSTNQELALPPETINQDAYKDGFQKALALVKLWMDSIYFLNN